MNHPDKISFFENIIYWLWHYSLKIKAMFPWRLAQLLTGILKYFNVALIAYIALEVANVNNPDIKGSVLGFLFPIILILDSIRYSNKKYCTRRVKHGWVCDEKYCTLKDKYDEMPKELQLKYKRTFLIYLISSITISIIAVNIIL